MKSKYLTLLLLLVLFLNKTFSQDLTEKIKGNWVLVELKKIDNEKFGYTKFEFLNNNVCFHSNSPIEKGNKFKYFIEDSIIRVNFTEYKIREINENKLILIDLYDKISTFTYNRPVLTESQGCIVKLDTIKVLYMEFSRPDESKIYPSVQSGLPDFDNRAIVFPEFRGEKSFTSFLSNEIQYSERYFKNENKRILNISFEILETGEISNIEVLDSKNDSWLVKKMSKVIQSKKNKWKAISNNGISYKSKITFPLVIELQTTKM